ncbi:MAG: transglutaminase-like domain-containing protein [Patescibacteria group bacterium]
MRFAARLFLTFSILTTYYLLLTTAAYADGEFETNYNITYQVEPAGPTNVTQAILLKNKTVNYYADKFELKIGSTKVENVKALDSVGPLEVDVKFERNITTITVKFNQRVIGIDKELPWTLSYTSNELTTKSGQIWEVSIPRIASIADIGTYDVKVQVPATFGPIAFAVPGPKTSHKDITVQEFTFDKSQLSQTGIALSFGEKQIFTFILDYYLENNNLTPRLSQITLPPDNNYQRVILEKINPPPQNVIVDRDGNFQAQYKLPPKQQLDVEVSGAVEVRSFPTRNIYQPLTEEEKNLYTQPQRYWETDNGFIRDKASELKTADKIYEFVTNFLSYSQERLSREDITRKGAASAIITPGDSVCMEFTDLFIAIARAAGIPTREVQGYAYTQNERLRPLSLALTTGDILHAWPEYWDDNSGWIQIDPTWGSTSGGLDYFKKLDFNHITFIQRGISSTDPYPAGAYKRPEDQGKKSVFVSFTEEVPETFENIKLAISTPDKIIAGIPLKVRTKVENLGNASIFGTTLEISSENLTATHPTALDLGILPPNSSRVTDFGFQAGHLLTRTQGKLTLTAADERVEKTVEIIPIYYLFVTPNFVLGLSLSAGIIILGFLLYIRFHTPKVKNPQI